MQKLIFRFLVLSLAGLDPMLLAQSQGTFGATGNMTTGRYAHTATVLDDGRVLVAGGFGSGFDAQATAELYDPATGTFTPTGDMTAARARQQGRGAPGRPGSDRRGSDEYIRFIQRDRAGRR